MKKILISAVIYKVIQYSFLFFSAQKVYENYRFLYRGSDHFLDYNLLYLGTSFLLLLAFFLTYKIAEYFSWKIWIFILLVIILLIIDMYFQFVMHIVFYFAP